MKEKIEKLEDLTKKYMGAGSENNYKRKVLGVDNIIIELQNKINEIIEAINKEK